MILKYGEFWTRLREELYHPIHSKEIKKQRSLEKYGVEYPAQSREVYLKTARAANKAHIVTHWKTQEDIICTGLWEKAVVEFFNGLKIDYDWQIPFNMPNKKVYICDMYIKDWDIYIEIKGRFFPVSKEKWDWFHSNHERSALWNGEVLEMIGIMPKYKDSRSKKQKV